MTRMTPSSAAPLVFGGTSGMHLSSGVCEYLGLEEGRLEISSFSDGESWVKILDNVRGADCYVIQATCPPVNQNLIELLLTIDALRRASAERINVVIPYFGYARQDRKDQGRVPVSAKLMANLVATAGASRVICLDLHSAQMQGFFDIPVDHLLARPVLLDYINKQPWTENLVVVSPDVGNVKMARAYATALNAKIAIIDKRRPRPNVCEVMNIIGDVKGQHALLVDDLIDTAGTICNAARTIMDNGALSVSACATHAVLSGPARERLKASPIERLIVTNSIPPRAVDELEMLEVVNIAPLIAETIHRIHNYLSVSEMFNSQSNAGFELLRRAESQAGK
ncbi:MAG: ribose-phosphate pyrophosphokinase [Candidatus Sumerlaeia bacterium]